MKTRKAAAPWARGLLRLIHCVEDGILIALLAAMILVGVAQILLRNVFDIGLLWADPLLRVLVLWVGLMGAVAASRDNKHINIDVLLRFLPRRGRAMAGVFVGIFTALVSGVVAYHAGRFVYQEYEVGTRTFSGIPVWIMELILPVGFALVAFSYALFSIANFREFLDRESDS